MRVSYSGLETFKRCPLKFKLQYLDKIRTAKSTEALFGTLIHKTLKMLHEPGLLIPTEEELLKFFADNWNPSSYQNEREAGTAFAQGVKMLKDYYAKNYPGQFNVVALETPFEVPFQIGNEYHLITGKIDRIDKTEENLFEVIDYKTTKKMPSQENVENDLQLSIYHMGIAARWPKLIEEKRPVKVSLYYLKHGEKLSSLRSPEKVEEVKENVLQTFDQIAKAQKEEKFSPRPNVLCDWCEYQKYCPLFRHKFAEQKIFFNDQDVKALIGEYMSGKEEVEKKEERIDEIKADLGKFMDQEHYERLFCDDGYIARSVIQRFKYDSETLKGVLFPLGIWENILKVDETKLKKFSKQLPREVQQKIEEAKKLDKEYKTFSVKKEKAKSKE